MIDATKPTDIDFLSSYAALIRETRVALNNNTATVISDAEAVVIPAATTAATVAAEAVLASKAEVSVVTTLSNTVTSLIDLVTRLSALNLVAATVGDLVITLPTNQTKITYRRNDTTNYIISFNTSDGSVLESAYTLETYGEVITLMLASGVWSRV